MGAWNMKMVMDCLNGADVAIADWKPRKYGAGRIRRLDTYDLALLLAIADRQLDESPGTNPDDCLCYGGEELLARITRMGTTKLEDCRDFLTAAGLITYAKSAACPEPLRRKVGKDTLDYVWRLNKAALVRMKSAGASVAASPPRGEGEPAVRKIQARHAGTKITRKKTCNSNMIPADADGLRNAEKLRAEAYVRYLARKYDLPPERQRLVGIEGIVAGTAGKRPDDVRRVIDRFGQTEMLERKFGTWIGLLVKRLKDLPKADDPNALPSAEELEAQFGPPKKVGANDGARQKAADGWNALFEGLGLAELPKARTDELRAAYERALARHANYLDDVIGKIVADAPYVSGKSETFGELREAMPDVGDRADKLAAELKLLTA